MKTLAVCVLLLGVVLPVPAAQASPVSIQNVRKWQAPDYTRLVFDLSGPVEQKVFVLHDPERVVIDLQSAHLNQPLPRLQFDGPVIDSLRTGAHGSDLRVVFGPYCASCHGPEGVMGIPNPGSDDGSVPALNPIDPTIASSDPGVFAVNVDLFIEHGSIPEGPNPLIMMPSFGDDGMLTDQQIADLIAYVMYINGVEETR